MTRALERLIHHIYIHTVWAAKSHGWIMGYCDMNSVDEVTPSSAPAERGNGGFQILTQN